MVRKIVHVINDFTTGGAQRTLLKLILEDKEKNHSEHTVILLISRSDEILTKLEENNIPYLFFFNKISFASPYKCIKFIRCEKPSVIQTWLYASDLFGIFFKLLSPGSKLIWNIRNGMPVRKYISLNSYLSALLCVKFSSIPYRIVCPSFDSIKRHVEFGYPKGKFVYIPNFMDTYYLKTYRETCISEKRQNNIINFGIMSRFDDQKGIDILLKAIDILPKNLNIRFTFIGSGLVEKRIYNLMDNLGIEKLAFKIDFEVKTNDILDFFKNIDFHISPSRSEAFPNAIFESMFFGKPNIATLAGDSEFIVSKFGKLIEINDYRKLSECIIEYTNFYNLHFESYILLSLQCHRRIKYDFDSSSVLQSYRNIWLKG